VVIAASRKPNIFCETENIKREAHEKLEIGELALGSGKGLEALPAIEHIPDATWAVLMRLMKAGELKSVHAQVAFKEGEVAMAEARGRDRTNA